MRPDRIGDYLDTLTRALRARGAYRRGLVDEIREHIADSVHAATGRGLSVDAAEDEALARLGRPDIVARHAAANVPRLRRGMLLTFCLLTMGSVAYLSLSLLMLQPPRASRAWPAEAVVALVVTALTYAWAKTGALLWWMRPILALGALTLGALGAVSIYAAATREFEGYRAVLGALFTIQALLTLVHLTRRSRGVLARS
jgi:HAAS